MKRNLAIIGILFSAFTTSAQVAGYMGKRFSISYQNFIFPSLPWGESKSPINISHNAEINLVSGNHSAFCFSFMYTPLKVSTDYLGYSNQYIFSDNKEFLKFNSTNYSVGFKLFLNRKKFSPLGTYIKWEVVYSRNNLHFDNYQAKEHPDGYSYNTYPYINHPSHSLVVSGGGAEVSLGKQRVFFDKLLVDYGIRAGFVLADATSGNSSNNIYEKKIVDKVSDIVFSQQFFNVKIGIGFLPF